MTLTCVCSGLKRETFGLSPPVSPDKQPHVSLISLILRSKTFHAVCERQEAHSLYPVLLKLLVVKDQL